MVIRIIIHLGETDVSQLVNKFIVAGNSFFYLKVCALALAPRWLSRSIYLLCSSGAKPSPAGTISMQKCREPGEVMLQIPNKFHCKNCQARKGFSERMKQLSKVRHKHPTQHKC